MARRYEQRLRAASAAETRSRILDAAHSLLRQAPTRPISVEEIARNAAVARSTVYTTFESRAGLFDALAAEIWDRAGYPRLLEAVRVNDAREGLRGGIAAGVEIFAADRDVFRAMFSMEHLDPDAVGGAIRRIEEQRADGMAWAARRLRAQGQLRPDVSESQAAHVIWLLASFDAFDLLYTGRGLSAKKTAELLVGLAESAVCR